VRGCGKNISIVCNCRTNHPPRSDALAADTAIGPPFSLDLIVRKPKNLKWRLEEGESFHTEIVTRGKVLCEAGDAGVGEETGG